MRSLVAKALRRCVRKWWLWKPPRVSSGWRCRPWFAVGCCRWCCPISRIVFLPCNSMSYGHRGGHGPGRGRTGFDPHPTGRGARGNGAAGALPRIAWILCGSFSSAAPARTDWADRAGQTSAAGDRRGFPPAGHGRMARDRRGAPRADLVIARAAQCQGTGPG